MQILKIYVKYYFSVYIVNKINNMLIVNENGKIVIFSI